MFWICRKAASSLSRLRSGDGCADELVGRGADREEVAEVGVAPRLERQRADRLALAEDGVDELPPRARPRRAGRRADVPHRRGGDDQPRRLGRRRRVGEKTTSRVHQRLEVARDVVVDLERRPRSRPTTRLPPSTHRAPRRRGRACRPRARCPASASPASAPAIVGTLGEVGRVAERLVRAREGDALAVRGEQEVGAGRWRPARALQRVDRRRGRQRARAS